MASEVEISGLKELDKLLKEFTPKLEANILRGALRAGAKVLLDKARENVPVDNGDLKNSLKLKTRNKRGALSATVTAGDKKAYYAHMIEFGTGSYYSGSGTRSKRSAYEIKPKKSRSLFFAGIFRETITHPGIRPQPFMRPAFDEGNQQALDAFKDYTKARIDKEFSKR